MHIHATGKYILRARSNWSWRKPPLWIQQEVHQALKEKTKNKKISYAEHAGGQQQSPKVFTRLSFCHAASHESKKCAERYRGVCILRGTKQNRNRLLQHLYLWPFVLKVCNKQILHLNFLGFVSWPKHLVLHNCSVFHVSPQQGLFYCCRVRLLALQHMCTDTYERGETTVSPGERWGKRLKDKRRKWELLLHGLG